MSAIASISLARSLSLKETMAAGIGVAVVVLLLSVTSLLHKASNIIPIPVIKGIQVGAGLSLCLNAGAVLSKLDYDGTQWDDNILWAVGAFAILYGTSRMPRFPVALAIFCMGVIIAFITIKMAHGSLPKFGIWMPFVPAIPSPRDFTNGFGTAGVGQIPLTILNSVIAVKYLSEDLLPYRPAPSVTSLGISVGLMNLAGCWFGAMPVCHGDYSSLISNIALLSANVILNVGSGGLAAQHRFGARSGASVMIFGLFKVAVGLMFGNSLTGLLQKFPKSLLGIMVGFAVPFYVLDILI